MQTQIVLGTRKENPCEIRKKSNGMQTQYFHETHHLVLFNLYLLLCGDVARHVAAVCSLFFSQTKPVLLHHSNHPVQLFLHAQHLAHV